MRVADWDLDLDVYYSNINQMRMETLLEGASFCMPNIMGSFARISHITIEVSINTKFLIRRADTA